MGGGQGTTKGAGGLARTRPEEMIGAFEGHSHVLVSNNEAPVKGTRALWRHYAWGKK